MRWLAATVLLPACSQSPTVIDTGVAADDTVPPIELIQATVTSVANPSLQSSSQLVSLYPSLEAGMPGPFSFPLDLPITVNPSLAGMVTVTVQGLDWNTSAVIAAGSTTAQVVAESRTHASLTLTSPTSCTAFAADAAPEAASANCDAGNDSSPD